MEQLQQTINKAIEMGWKPRGSESIIGFTYVEHNDYNSKFMMHKNGDPWTIGYIVGLHDIFSKDSGLMEFMKWKDLHLTLYLVTGHYVNMCMMTSQEKIDYFNKNAYLPRGDY